MAGTERAPRQLSSSSCTVVKLDGHAYVLYRQGVTCAWAKDRARQPGAPRGGGAGGGGGGGPSRGRAKPGGWSCTSGAKYRGNAWCERGEKHFGWDDGS